MEVIASRKSSKKGKDKKKRRRSDLEVGAFIPARASIRVPDRFRMIPSRRMEIKRSSSISSFLKSSNGSSLKTGRISQKRKWYVAQNFFFFNFFLFAH
jgi:hypothetical protein